MIKYDEAKNVYDVDGVEVPKAAYDSIHSEGAAGTNRRVKQMVAGLYPDRDPKEFETMTIKQIAEFIDADRQAIKASIPKHEPKPEPKGKEPEIDVKLALAQKEAELEKQFKAKEAAFKRERAISELRQEAIAAGLRDDLRDPKVFEAFVSRRWNLDEASLQSEKLRWVDVQKDQIAIGSDGKEADASTLAKMLVQLEPNSFVTRKTAPGPMGIKPGIGATPLKDLPTEQLLAMNH